MDELDQGINPAISNTEGPYITITNWGFSGTLRSLKDLQSSASPVSDVRIP
jgi:hypothetical protein